MATSLVETFGDRALAVTLSQSADRDVGGDSGITWIDVGNALRTRMERHPVPPLIKGV